MSSIVQTVLIVAALVLLPAYYLYVLWRRRSDAALHWIAKAMYTGAFLLFVFVAGPWDWVSVYLRYVWIGLFVLIALLAWTRGRRSPRQNPRVAPGMWGDVFTLVIFLGFLLFGLRGYFYSGEPVHLAFPLRDGQYYVGQGGNSPLINYHNTYEPQRYALDIVALNAFGARASGFYPSNLESYAIYGATVYSPCDGIVTRAVDGLPDLAPGDSDPSNAPGNHVVIACEGVNVLLAHFKQGSVGVEVGANVASGQPIAQVGNSGNTSEPHLHVHAVVAAEPDSIEGKGVPILFDGRFAVRNTIFKR